MPRDKIRQEIELNEGISFARFMELALYCPGSGYYEKETDTVGKLGDFYTSVSVGTVFGQLLGFQFAQWQADSGREGAFQLVEAGAHDGRLAADMLGWLRERRPDFFEKVEYWIVEPSLSRRARQEKTLAGFKGKVRWAVKLEDIMGGVGGVIFSNELLDAMPVQRFGWDAKRGEWFEWGVGSSGDGFEWMRLKKAVQKPQVPDELLAVLPDGFTLEISPASHDWWREAAKALRWGKLVTLDYGLSAEEFLTPQRKDGTVRAYYRHRLVPDVLANPGEQDITAHVDFTAIRSVGEAAGLKTEAFQTQVQFLTGIARQTWEDKKGFSDWTAEQTRQFQTLIHPEHLGRAFRVLVQSR